MICDCSKCYWNVALKKCKDRKLECDKYRKIYEYEKEKCIYEVYEIFYKKLTTLENEAQVYLFCKEHNYNFVSQDRDIMNDTNTVMCIIKKNRGVKK